MADSDLGKTAAQKDDVDDNSPCPRFNSFSTPRVPCFRTTCCLPFSFPAAGLTSPFHSVLCPARASDGNAPPAHMAGLPSFASTLRPPVSFLVFPLLSNRSLEGKKNYRKRKEGNYQQQCNNSICTDQSCLLDVKTLQLFAEDRNSLQNTPTKSKALVICIT